jgi:CMP-2-keto-3-deoxyoctulosonic acid synthetase
MEMHRNGSRGALENGIQIAVVKVDYDSVGVDVLEDVAKVEKILATDGHG